MTASALLWHGASVGFAVGAALTEPGWRGVVWTVVATVGVIVGLGAWEGE